jgi:phosphate starvation-inducible PhoH-like protein
MEVTIELASQEEAIALFGVGDQYLRLIRDALGVRITARQGVVKLAGDSPSLNHAASILHDMSSMWRRGVEIPRGFVEGELARFRVSSEDGGAPSGVGEDEGAVAGTAERGSQGDGASEVALDGAAGAVRAPDRALCGNLARSPGQRNYVEAILRHDIVFCIGPAGTGKTYLAVRLAVNALRSGQVRKIILCRPAVEAGEKLGFLPGDFQAKINPYLRPLYDALNDTLDFDQVKRYVEREIIEVIPLAYMRGRTLNNAYIILDEGQNTTVSQMKMFLTRMGSQSKIVVNGDITQVDLLPGQPSGLIHARRVIQGIEGIAWVEMHRADIVRHPLVRRIVKAYESEERGE